MQSEGDMNRIGDILILLNQSLVKLAESVRRIGDTESERDARREREHDVIRRDLMDLRMQVERVIERINETRTDIKDVRDEITDPNIRLAAIRGDDDDAVVKVTGKIGTKQAAKIAGLVIGT